jgi:predicted metal-dependent peptidase
MNVAEVNEVIKSLYLDFPLFGEVLIHVERKVTTAVPTAAVTNKLDLLINPDFWSRLNYDEKKAILAHEVMHLMFDHFIRFKDVFEHDHQLVNSALDCAINQLISFPLPDGTVTIEMLETVCGKLERKQSAEYYYKKLKDVKSKLIDQISSFDHSKQFEGEQTTIDRARVENILKKAIEKQRNSDRKMGVGAGDSILDVIPDRVRTNQNIWKSLINRSMGENVTDPYYIYGKQSRRDCNNFFGKRMDMKSNYVYVIVDTSGSISNDDMSKSILRFVDSVLLLH